MIIAFLAGHVFAIVGASADRGKYGNRVLRAYLESGRKAFPVNPREKAIEGLPSYPDLASLPEPVHGVSIVTPPHVTREILEQAAAAKIRHVWMQPGAEPDHWRKEAERLGLAAIGGGACALVELAAASRQE